MGFSAGSIEADLVLNRDPFQRGLKEARAEGKAFERNPLKAILDLDKSRFDRVLKAAEAKGAAFARKHFTATVDANTKVADAKLDAVAAKADAIGRKRETIHVAVNYDQNRIRQLLGAMRTLKTEGGGVGGTISRGFTAAGSAASGFGRKLMPLTKWAVILGLSGPLATGLVGLTGSLWQATKGIGALAVAAGGATVALGLLAGGAIMRFKAQADKAGTAAHQLKNRLEGLKQIFGFATGRGADAVFRGMSQGIRALIPAVGKLHSAFTVLGRAWGKAFADLGKRLAGLQPSFSRLIKASAPLAGPLTRAFSNLLHILTNIARAAMPFLVQGAHSLANWLGRVADRTSDLRRMHGVIGGLVGHFKSWLNLIHQIGRIFGGIFSALDSRGKSLVDTLAQGAKNLADWTHSAAGQQKIKQFWDQMLPVLQGIGGAIKEFVPVFLEFLKNAGPGLTTMLKLLTGIFKWLNQHPTISKFVAAFALFGPMALRIVGPVLSLVGALGRLYVAWKTLSTLKALSLGSALGGAGAGAAGAGFFARLASGFKAAGKAGGAALMAAVTVEAVRQAPSIGAKIQKFLMPFSPGGPGRVPIGKIPPGALPIRDAKIDGKAAEGLYLIKRGADAAGKSILGMARDTIQAKARLIALSAASKFMSKEARLRISTPGAQQAMNSLKHLERFRLTSKQQKIIQKGGPEAVKMVEKLMGIKLTPKQQAILEKGGKEALAMVQKLQAKKLAQKTLRVAIRHGDIPSIASHLNRISNFKMKGAIKRIVEHGSGTVRQRLNALRRYIDLARARKQISEKGYQATKQALDTIKGYGDLGTATKWIRARMLGSVPGIGGLLSKMGKGGPVPAYPAGGVTRGGVFANPTLLRSRDESPFLVGDHLRGPAEVVISPDPSVRRENIGYWRMAAKMLGIPGFAKGGLASFASGGTTGSYGPISAAGTAVRSLTSAVQRMMDRFARHTRRRSILEEMLGTPSEIKGYGKAIGAMRDKLSELAKTAVEGFIDMRLQIEQMALDTSPLAKQLSRMQRQDTATERKARSVELQQRLDDARKAQVRKPGELEADFEERRIQGARDEAAVLAEIEAEKRHNTEEDLQAELDRRRQAAEDKAESAKLFGDQETDAYAAQLDERFGLLLADLAKRRITIEQFERGINQIAGRGGVSLGLSSDEMVSLLGGWPEDREKKKGQKKVKPFVARTSPLIAAAHGARQRSAQPVLTRPTARHEANRIARHEEALRDLDDKQVKLQASMDRTLKQMHRELQTLPARMPKPKGSGIDELNQALRTRTR